MEAAKDHNENPDSKSARTAIKKYGTTKLLIRGARDTNLIMLNRIKKKTCFCDPPCKHVSFLWIYVVRWNGNDTHPEALAVTIYDSFSGCYLWGPMMIKKTFGCQTQLLPIVTIFKSQHTVAKWHDIYWLFLNFARNNFGKRNYIYTLAFCCYQTHTHTCT